MDETTTSVGEGQGTGTLTSPGGATAAPVNAGPNETSAAGKTFTQDELNRIIQERLAAHEKKLQRRAEEERAKEQGEWQKVAEQRETELRELQQAVRQMELERLRDTAASKHNLPTPLAARLKGETLEELEADARELAAVLQKSLAPPPPPVRVAPANPSQPRSAESVSRFAIPSLDEVFRGK